MGDGFARTSSYESYIKLTDNLINPKKTSKSIALSSVPFSCCFYSSRPLSAVMTRRRFQVLHVVLNAAELVLRIFTVSNTESCISSRRFKFSSMAVRSYSATLEPSISSFMPMRDGVELNQPHSFYSDNSTSIILSFSDPVEWNGWNFVTSKSSHKDQDPIRFSLYATMRDDDQDWQLVGSSTYINFAGHISLWHGPFITSELRGHKHTFDLLRDGQLGLFKAVSRAICALIASLSSAAEATNISVLFVALPEFILGANHLIVVAVIPSHPHPVQSFALTHIFPGRSMIPFSSSSTSRSPPLAMSQAACFLLESQRAAAAIFAAFAACNLATGALLRLERWLTAAALAGGFITALAAAIAPFDIPPTRARISVSALLTAFGSPLLLAALLVMALRRRQVSEPRPPYYPSPGRERAR